MSRGFASTGTLLLLVMILIVSSSDLRAEDASTEHSKKELSWPWIDKYYRFVLLGIISDSDSLRGLQAGYGVRGILIEAPASATLSLVVLDGRSEQVVTLRGDFLLFVLPADWMSAGPLFSGALEYRSENPSEGYGGYLGAGVGIAMWTPNRWHFTLGAERAFGVSSESRNQLLASVGFAFK
jgi:hypothetical protein